MNKNSAIVDYAKLLGFNASGSGAGAVDFKSGVLAGPVGAKVGGTEPNGPVALPRAE